MSAFCLCADIAGNMCCKASSIAELKARVWQMSELQEWPL
ncbi:rCG29653 [Rattus norvegicus]|uniref:RCG29653 n=1 Tax=Rattus norvegicus TaxID=10116 RepID=A6ILV1_RAT|nr:rCG29653 [Rattus norvegicus]